MWTGADAGQVSQAGRQQKAGWLQVVLRRMHPPPAFARTVLRRGASIGANATVLGGVEIGAGAMVGAGSVVTRDIPAGELWLGNPARRRGPAPRADDLTAQEQGAGA